MSNAEADFSKRLQQNKMSSEEITRLAGLTYGLHKIDQNYNASLIESVKEEIQQKNVMQGGYASEYINPENKIARRRFLHDALQIFNNHEEFIEIITNKIGKSKFTNFYSFIQTYLGVVRDLTGSLFSRDQLLIYTSLNPTENGLTEEDMKARRKVFSLHYLGDTERLFQILEELRPLADIAYGVNCEFFKRDVIEDQLTFARNALDKLLLEEHGIDSTVEERLPIPTDLPQKPLSKNEEKRIEKAAHDTKIAQLLREQQAEEKVKEKKSHTKNPSPAMILPPSNDEEGDSEETYREWVYRTEYATKSGKSEYRKLTEEQRRKEQKSEKKQFKKEITKINKNINNNTNCNSVVFDVKIENIPVQENVKRTIHSPHKNGSKKLRPEHIKAVKNILLDGGYTTLEAIQHLDVGSGPRSVFQDIHDLTFSGTMDKVINMIRALKGHVDETRSGSRIGFFLRHVKTNAIVGTDLLPPSDDS